MENAKPRPARKPRQPVRWLVLSVPATPAQLEHRAKLEAEGFKVRTVTEHDLARAG